MGTATGRKDIEQMPATCFVMMPFTGKFRVLYEHVIAEAIRSVGLEPRTGHSYEPDRFRIS